MYIHLYLCIFLRNNHCNGKLNVVLTHWGALTFTQEYIESTSTTHMIILKEVSIYVCAYIFIITAHIPHIHWVFILSYLYYRYVQDDFNDSSALANV